MPAAARKSKPKVNKSITPKTTVREAVPHSTPVRSTGRSKAPVTVKAVKQPPETAPVKRPATKAEATSAKTQARPIKKAAEISAPVHDVKKVTAKTTSPKSTKQAPAKAPTKEKAVAIGAVRAVRRAETPEVIAKPKTATRRKKQTQRKKVSAATREVQSVREPSASRSRQKNAGATTKVAKPTTKRVAKSVAPELTLTMPTGAKSKRARVPKDLAVQYGEKEKRRVQPESAATKRARRDAALRQKMRDAMEVGDDLVLRLRRAGMIGGEIEETNGNGHAHHSVRTNSAPRRSRKWEACCGKCGVKTLFKTPAGLCARCGAIMVRE